MNYSKENNYTLESSIIESELNALNSEKNLTLDNISDIDNVPINIATTPMCNSQKTQSNITVVYQDDTSKDSIFNSSSNVITMLPKSQTQTAHLLSSSLKRPISTVNTGQPVVKKFLIAKNASGNFLQIPRTLIQVSQSQPQQVIWKTSGVSKCLTVASGVTSVTSPGTKFVGSTSLLSPTKLISPDSSSPLKVGTKLTASPNKSTSHIKFVPVSANSPQRIVSGPGTQVITMVAKSLSGNSLITNSGNNIKTSPKMIIKQQSVNTNKPVIAQQISLNSNNKTPTTLSLSGAQPLSISGSKFQYVRLVPTTSSTTVSNMKSIAPVSIIQPNQNITSSASVTSSAQQIKVSLAPQNSLPKPKIQTVLPKTSVQSQTQRLILPANSSFPPIQPAISASISSLPPGTIIQSGQNLSAVQSFTIVPAQYVTQIQPQSSSSQNFSSDNYITVASSAPSVNGTSKPINGCVSEPAPGQRPRKPCNCTKSQCLKLYCDCFANGEFCHNCNCHNCANNLEHEDSRSKAIKSCLDRNPNAFHPKIGKTFLGKTRDGDLLRRHNKGCNCKRSGCLKNYCECYEAKILCTALCKCCGCKNFEESPDRKTLMHLADAAEVRVLQQTAAKAKLSSQIQDLPHRNNNLETGERLPYTFITKEVAEATCSCLIAQAEEAERINLSENVQERMILEEFGRCLLQVIESANKTKVLSPVQ